MKASPFYQHIHLRHSGADYPESRLPAIRKGCHVCGGRPVLRLAGNHGFCKHHPAAAWAECARRTNEKLEA